MMKFKELGKCVIERLREVTYLGHPVIGQRYITLPCQQNMIFIKEGCDQTHNRICRFFHKCLLGVFKVPFLHSATKSC